MATTLLSDGEYEILEKFQAFLNQNGVPVNSRSQVIRILVNNKNIFTKSMIDIAEKIYKEERVRRAKPRGPQKKN
ncbi:MAG: hypothetical protein SFY92_00530 [Verrucomicrobiae bacterium]|nr:hypothetical protein [Verrucomicrobiae bacterium]